jgi:tetratricopeptide (TPR) repeat protein
MEPHPNLSASDPARLGPKGEEAWQQLRQHTEWAEEFWLIFVFAPLGVGPKVLEERMSTLLQSNQVVLSPDTPDELRELLPDLLKAPLTKTRCIWVEAVHRDISARSIEDDAWAKAWDWFLLRANERREVLRSTLKGGLILVAPIALKSRFREAAPDLWSIRSLVLELDDPTVPGTSKTEWLNTVDSFPDPEPALREARRLAARKPDTLLPQARALSRAALGLSARDAFAEANDIADQVISILDRMNIDNEATKNHSSKIALASVLGQLGETLVRLHRLDEAERSMQKAISFAEELGDRPNLAVYYNNMSLIEKPRGRLDEAEKWLQKAIVISEQLGDSSNLAIGYNNMSTIEQARGRLDEAEKWLQKAIEIAEQIGDRPKLAPMYNNMSTIEQACGRLDEAEKWLQKAIDIDEQLGDRPNLAGDYNNMSTIEKHRGRLDEAEKWLQKGIDIAEQLGDRPNLALMYNNMSQIEQTRGRLDGAEKWLQKAIDIAEQLSDRPNLAIDYNNMSTIEKDRGRLDKAEKWLQKAIDIAEQLGDRQGMAIRYNNMSQIKKERGNPDAAEMWLDKAWSMIADLSPSETRRVVGTRYAELLVSRGKENEARAVKAKL